MQIGCVAEGSGSEVSSTAASSSLGPSASKAGQVAAGVLEYEAIPEQSREDWIFGCLDAVEDTILDHDDQHLCEECEENSDDGSEHLVAVVENPTEEYDTKEIMIDSGAVRTVFKRGDFKAEVEEDNNARPLMDINGNLIQQLGKQSPSIILPSGKRQRLKDRAQKRVNRR